MTNYVRRKAWLRKTTGACSSDLTHRKHCCCSQMKVHLEITSRASGHVTFELLGIPLSLELKGVVVNVLSICASSVEYSAKPDIGSYRVVSSIHPIIVVRGDCPHGLHIPWELHTVANPGCCRHKILCSSEVSCSILGTNKRR